ncbi:MAG: hypothetical protein MUP26_09590, partial [Desulfobulbaceae bacterium]|nr:hypothetical protein [Desulfobulbaceae bacterium]
MNVFVTDCAAVTALGSNLEELCQGLMAGKTAIHPVQRFPVLNYRSRFAACIEGLSTAGRSSMTHDLLNRLVPQLRGVPTDAMLITATT